jgi:ribose transport system permease protein
MQLSQPTRDLRRIVLGSLRQQGILYAFVLFLLGVAIAYPTILSAGNVLTVLRQVSIIGVMALGVTFVVIAGQLDLSVGSLLSLTTVMVVNLHDQVGPLLAIVIMLGAAAAIGSVNGLLVGYFRLNSLIVTLGMLSLLQGLTFIYSSGTNVIIRDPDHTWFAVFGRGFVFHMPVPMLLFLGLAVVLGIVLHFSGYGRRVFAVGGNATASAFSGVRSRRVIFSTYVISALCVGLAAVILGSRVMGSQNTVGQGYELQVLATIILGGTSLLGGSGSMFKTVIGVLILGFIQNALLLLGFAYYAQWVVTWGVIISAVWLDVASKRGRLFA